MGTNLYKLVARADEREAQASAALAVPAVPNAVATCQPAGACEPTAADELNAAVF